MAKNYRYFACYRYNINILKTAISKVSIWYRYIDIGDILMIFSIYLPTSNANISCRWCVRSTTHLTIWLWHATSMVHCCSSRRITTLLRTLFQCLGWCIDWKRGKARLRSLWNWGPCCRISLIWSWLDGVKGDLNQALVFLHLVLHIIVNSNFH